MDEGWAIVLWIVFIGAVLLVMAGGSVLKQQNEHAERMKLLEVQAVTQPAR